MSRNIKFLGLLAAVVALLLVGATAGASSPLTVHHPEDRATQPGLGNDGALAPPQLLPGSRASYTPQALGTLVARPDGHAVAQLATPPDGATALGINTHALPTIPEGRIAFTVLSSLKYAIGTHQVFVTTTRPSAAAAQRPLSLGNETVQLANGTMAWIATNVSPEAPNQVVFTQDDLIITIAGDLPVGELRGLATRIVLAH